MTNQRRNPGQWSLERSLSATGRFLCAATRHVLGGHGDTAELAHVVELLGAVENLRDELARRLLREGSSYGDLAPVLGITRQAVCNRYPGESMRAVGGQPGELR